MKKMETVFAGTRTLISRTRDRDTNHSTSACIKGYTGLEET